MDYTLNKYRELCQAISSSRYSTTTLAEYLEQGNLISKSYIILRHDIDRSPHRALGVTKIEHENRICATYYFRTSTFSPEVIDKVLSFGHEIGFHYETLDKCRGDIHAAITLFKEQLAMFREKYEIKTVCAHGNPLTRFDNKEIWKHIKLNSLSLLGEAFLGLDFSRFAYFSDSGRTWQNNESQKMPGKDSVVTAFDGVNAKTTDDIIRIIKDGSLPNICILTHPERWCEDILSCTSRFILDRAFSTGKNIITIYRKIF